MPHDLDAPGWLPPGRILVLPGRGETFARVGPPPRPDRGLPAGAGPPPVAPAVLLLHGWLATADLTWFATYRPLAERALVLATDHRGHGRGLRGAEPFTLEAAADDAAATLDVLRAEGNGLAGRRTIVCGYSMGGPIALLLAQRRPDLVDGLVLCSTALSWRDRRSDGLRWRTVGLAGAALRRSADARATAHLLDAVAADDPVVRAHRDHLVGEAKRLDVDDAMAAVRSLSRFDGRELAAALDRPVAVVATRRDRVVPPRRQLALAAATSALRFDLDADHIAFLRRPQEWAATVVAAVASVAARLPQPPTTKPTIEPLPQP